MTTTETTATSLARRLLLPAALVVALVLVGHFGGQHFESIEAWIAGLGHLGPLVFSGVYLVLVALGFPVSALGISAGLLFGFAGGAALLVVDGILCGSLIYVLARRFFRERILRWVAARPRMAAFERLAHQRSLRLMLLLRLSPINYAAVCYLLGASRIGFRLYGPGLLAIVPSALIQAWVGHAAGQLAGADNAATRTQNIWAAVGIVFCLVLMAVIGDLARRALKEAAKSGKD